MLVLSIRIYSCMRTLIALQDTAQDLNAVDSCEYIWAAGVGFAQTHAVSAVHDSNRTEILKLLLTCLSYSMYQVSTGKQAKLDRTTPS